MFTRREFLKAGLAAGACAGLASVMPSVLEAKENGYNVLFIAVDDLRPELGCYGVSKAKTPNIDALAARGTQFNRAYCQQAVCSPTRTSLLTGCRPDTTKVYNLEDHFRKFIPDVVTLPQYFKQQGYFTQGLSKIYHPGLDDPASWSVPHWQPKAPNYGDPEAVKAIQDQIQSMKAQGKYVAPGPVESDSKTGVNTKIRPGTIPKGPAWESDDVPDNKLADGMTADKAIECLGELKDKKFFLAVGFLKPHLPFVAPKKYYDLYADTKFTVADNPFAPKDCPEVAVTNWGELRAYKGMPKDGAPMTDKIALELIRGYHAAASYTDAQIGRVVGELDRLGLREKTIIVLWGDHGWQLGEHGQWCKHTNFEEATRVPLIISAPNQKNKGAKTDSFAEFVDVYPTLCSLAGLPKPKGLEGTSLVPVMNNPKVSVKTAAFSQYPRPGNIMGYTMRTDRYRYTEWSEKGKDPMGVEMYDYKAEPEGNVNIANLPENKELAAKLSKMLHDGYKAALVKGK